HFRDEMLSVAWRRRGEAPQPARGVLRGMFARLDVLLATRFEGFRELRLAVTGYGGEIHEFGHRATNPLYTTDHALQHFTAGLDPVLGDAIAITVRLHRLAPDVRVAAEPWSARRTVGRAVSGGTRRELLRAG